MDRLWPTVPVHTRRRITCGGPFSGRVILQAILNGLVLAHSPRANAQKDNLWGSLLGPGCPFGRPFGPPPLARRCAGVSGRAARTGCASGTILSDRKMRRRHCSFFLLFNIFASIFEKNINRRSALQFRNFSVSPKIFRALRND